MRFLESALLRRVSRRQTAVELGPRTKFVVFCSVAIGSPHPVFLALHAPDALHAQDDVALCPGIRPARSVRHGYLPERSRMIPPLAVNSPNPAGLHAAVETSSRPSRASCGKAGYSACDAPTWGRGPDPSHSSVDKPGVEELARRLKKGGIEPFLDKWNLIPGQPWQEALKEAMGQSASCAVIIGSGPFGPWHHGVSNPRAIIGVAARSDTDRVSPSRPPASGRCPGRNSSEALWSATACRFFLSSRFRGRPPFRPRARAACGLNQGATDGIVIGPADHVRDDRDEFLVWPWDDWKSGVSSTRLFGTRSGRFVPSIRDDRATSAVRARLLPARPHGPDGRQPRRGLQGRGRGRPRPAHQRPRPARRQRPGVDAQAPRTACRHGDCAEWVRERRGHPAEPGSGLRRPSDQAHRPPEAGGDEPAGRLVRGSAMQEVRCRGMKRAGAGPAPQ